MLAVSAPGSASHAAALVALRHEFAQWRPDRDRVVFDVRTRLAGLASTAPSGQRDVAGVILFGSVARDGAHEDSDIDLLVISDFDDVYDDDHSDLFDDVHAREDLIAASTGLYASTMWLSVGELAERADDGAVRDALAEGIVVAGSDPGLEIGRPATGHGQLRARFDVDRAWRLLVKDPAFPAAPDPSIFDCRRAATRLADAALALSGCPGMDRASEIRPSRTLARLSHVRPGDDLDRWERLLSVPAGQSPLADGTASYAGAPIDHDAMRKDAAALLAALDAEAGALGA